MALNDFLAKQPIDVIINTDISDQKVVLPVNVEPDPFYKEFKGDIESAGLSTEKAIYIGSIHEKQPYQDASTLLNSKVKY